MNLKYISQWIAKRLIFAAACLLLFLAVVISAGREFSGTIIHSKKLIEDKISTALHLDVKSSAISADWRGLNPSVIFSDFELYTPGQTKPMLEVMKLQAEISLIQSIINRKLILGDIHVYAPSLSVVQRDSDTWGLAHGPITDAKSEAKKSFDTTILDFFGDVAVHYASVSLVSAKGVSYQIKDLSFNASVSSNSLRAAGDATLDKGGIIPLQFDLDLDGDWLQPADIEFDIYLGLSGVDVFDFIPSQKVAGFDVEDFKFGTQLWINGEEGVVTDATVLLNVPKARFSPPNSAQDHEVELLTTFLHWQFDDGEWDLAIDRTSFFLDGAPFDLEPVSISYNDNEEFPWFIYAKQVDVGKIAALAPMVLPDEQYSFLRQLAPSALLRDSQLELSFVEKPRFRFKSNISDLSIKPVADIPGVENVSGYIESDERVGFLDFYGQDVIFNYASLFRSGWIFDAGSGHLSWAIGNESYELAGEQLSLAGDFGDFRGEFYAYIPYDERAGELDLNLGVLNANAQHTPAFLPADIMEATLVDWIDSAIKGGQVVEGAYVYQGSTALAATETEFTSSMFFDVKGGTVKYQNEWPELTEVKGVVVVDSLTQVFAESASLLDTALHGVAVEYDAVLDAINVDSNVVGHVKDIGHLLKSTPLKNELSEDIQAFDAKGALDGSIALVIPLREGEVSVKTQFFIQRGHLAMPRFNLTLDDIEGQFNFDSDKGVEAKGITAQFLDRPFTVDIRANRNKDNVPDSSIQFKGNVLANTLKKWSDSPWVSYLDGETAIEGEVLIQGGDEGSKLDSYLRLKSSLEGLAVNLPEPIGKKTKAKRNLNIKLGLNENRKKALVHYGRDLTIAALFDDDGFKGAHIGFGRDEKISYHDSGVIFTGRLSRLDLDPWRKLMLSSIGGSTASTKSTNYDLFDYASINVDDLKLFDRHFENLDISLDRKRSVWVVDAKNRMVDGTFELFDDDSLPVSIQLAYLNIPYNETGDDSAAALTNFSPSDIPPLSVKIDQLALGKERYGSWDVNVAPIVDGMKVSVNKVDVKGMVLNDASWLQWTAKNKIHQTSMYLDASTENIASVLEQWGYAKAMESESGEFKFSSIWDGTPAEYDRLKTIGELELSIEDGRFLEVEQSARVLRLIGIFNVTKIARRMRLDFSDLYQTGFQYDSINGILSIKNGIASWKEDLKVNSPSSSFSFSGSVNFKDETLNQKMLVTLPVSENLPWYAVLAAQPAVAVGLWVVNELFEDQINKFSSARYTVTGSFDDPKIEFDKLFDRMRK